MDETAIRKSERYQCLHTEIGKLSEGLAGYITIAGALMFGSALFFGGGGGENPYFLGGVGVSCLLGGGGYWLHCRSERDRLRREMDAISEFFARRGYYIRSDGSLSPK